MFSNFVTFTEVVKLSSNVFYEMKTINYHDKLLKLIKQKRDIDTFEEIIHNVEDKHLITEFIATALGIDAARWIRNIFEMIDYIDITAFDNSLIISSSKYGLYNFVKLLAERGADIHAQNGRALVLASSLNHIDIVKYLVEKSLPSYSSIDYALQKAAGNCLLEIVQYLLERGADIHADYNWALKNAVRKGHIDVVKFLIERPDCKVCKKYCRHGANIHTLDSFDIQLSRWNGNFEIDEYLKKIIASGTNL